MVIISINPKGIIKFFDVVCYQVVCIFVRSQINRSLCRHCLYDSLNYTKTTMAT